MLRWNCSHSVLWKKSYGLNVFFVSRFYLTTVALLHCLMFQISNWKTFSWLSVPWTRLYSSLQQFVASLLCLHTDVALCPSCCNQFIIYILSPSQCDVWSSDFVLQIQPCCHGVFTVLFLWICFKSIWHCWYL